MNSRNNKTNKIDSLQYAIMCRLCNMFSATKWGNKGMFHY